MPFKSSQSNPNTTSEPYHPSMTNDVGIANNRAPAARLRAAPSKRTRRAPLFEVLLGTWNGSTKPDDQSNAVYGSIDIQGRINRRASSLTISGEVATNTGLAPHATSLRDSDVNSTFPDTKAYRSKLLTISSCRCSWTWRARNLAMRRSGKERVSVKVVYEKEKKSTLLAQIVLFLFLFYPKEISQGSTW